MGDAALGVGAQICVSDGLDLAGTADHRGQILAHDLGGQNLGITRLLLVDHDSYQHGGHDNGESN